MSWQAFLSRNESRLESPFEAAFVKLVLANVPGLTPDMVECQTSFEDSAGITRRIDFAVTEDPGVRLALEVDGWDKRGTGTGMSRTDFVAWSRRELDMSSQGWTVLRFANSLVTHRPEECARHIELVLARERSRAQAAHAYGDSRPAAFSPDDAAELSRLEARRESALHELETRLSAAEGENRRMRTVAVAFAVVVLAFAGLTYLLTRPAQSVPTEITQPPEDNPPPTVQAPRTRPLQARTGTATQPTCQQPVLWSTVADYLGETIAIQGPIVGATYRPDVGGQPTFLNMGLPFPEPGRLTLVIWGRDRSNFSGTPEDTYAGSEVCVVGRVTLHEGEMRVEVGDPSSVTVLMDPSGTTNAAVTVEPREDHQGGWEEAGFCPGGVSWSDAPAYVGTEVSVVGPVVDASFRRTTGGQPTFLNIGAAFPDPKRFTVLVWGRDRGAFAVGPIPDAILRQN